MPYLTLTAHTSRRDTWIRRVLVSVSALFGLSAPFWVPGQVPAKKKKKLKRNALGCVNVGGKCRGNDANCCSGLCHGKKPKKGEKDKSRCVAHNVPNCPARAVTCCEGENSFATACVPAAV